MGTLVFQANLGGAVNLVGPNTASTVNFTLPSADGSSGQALVTNGSGTLSFSSFVSAAAGSNTQVQFNSSGAFAGSANLTFNGTTLTAANTSVTTSETLSYGTANGVAYLNGSKVVTTGSALTFDGTNFVVGSSAAFTVGTGTLVQSQAVGASGYVAARYSANASEAVVNFGKSRSGVNATLGVAVASGDRLGGLQFYGDDGTSWIQGAKFWAEVNGTVSTGSVPSNFVWSLSGSEQMRLTSTGLGIGTSSPGYKLQVTTNQNANTTIGVSNSTAGTSSVARFLALSDTANASFGVTSSLYTDITNAANAAYINSSGAGGIVLANSGVVQAKLDTSGNLGLGVTPSGWGGGIRAFQVGSTGSLYNLGGPAVGFNTYNNGANNLYLTSDFASIYSQTSGQHRWFTAPSGTAGNAITFTQAMTLDASGNLGIGTTSPQTRLVVSSGNENIEFSTGNVSLNGGVMEYINRTTATTRPDFNYYIGTAGSHKFFTNGSERARIDSNGNLLVGTAAIATNATDGFLYIPTCAGTPTGTPTTKTGLAPMVIDSTNNKMYIYSGGAWRALN